MAGDHVTFNCIQVTQPIGTFYIGAVDSTDLVDISYADVRRISERDVELYLGIQRPLSPARVKELAQYVSNIDASFPTSIILAVSSADAEFDSHTNLMKIRKDDGVAKIIDGQHRIAGLEKYRGAAFQLNVTIFVDMDLEDQAMVFATINLKQTKVSKSLAYDLYEFAEARSPQKTCHNVAKLLNNRNSSPLKNKIKILGVATGKPEESITQATFVDRLMPYISKDPMGDRDIIKRRGVPERGSDLLKERRIFRNLFLDDKDAEIAKIVWNYFKSVEQKWPSAWATRQRGLILNRTTGFGALMRFLRNCYVSFGRPGKVPTSSEFYLIFKGMQLTDQDFNPYRYVPGSEGEGQLFADLVRMSGLPN